MQSHFHPFQQNTFPLFLFVSVFLLNKIIQSEKLHNLFHQLFQQEMVGRSCILCEKICSVDQHIFFSAVMMFFKDNERRLPHSHLSAQCWEWEGQYVAPGINTLSSGMPGLLFQIWQITKKIPINPFFLWILNALTWIWQSLSLCLWGRLTLCSHLSVKASLKAIPSLKCKLDRHQ